MLRILLIFPFWAFLIFYLNILQSFSDYHVDWIELLKLIETNIIVWFLSFLIKFLIHNCVMQIQSKVYLLQIIHMKVSADYVNLNMICTFCITHNLRIYRKE